MKIVFILSILLLSGLATLGKIIFPGIEDSSSTARMSFGFWTLVVPIIIGLVVAYRLFFRQK